MSSEDEALVATLTEGLVRRLLALEGPMRPKAARQILESLPVERAVELLGRLLVRAESGDARAQEALAAIAGALSDLADDEVAAAIYAEAQRRNALGVRRLLMRPAPARRFNPNEEQTVDREMRKVDLGMRKQMARRADPVLLSRLQTDPDPAVIANLLRHPRLTEPEVVRMAARRPGRPEVLGEIYRSPRWGVRTRVRYALANNPYTPTDLSLKLVPLLPLTELKSVALNGTLHEEVRRAAQARVAEARRRHRVAQAAANLADLDPEGDA